MSWRRCCPERWLGETVVAAPPELQSPVLPAPAFDERMVGQVVLQRCHRDVLVAQRRDVGVFFGLAQSKDAGVPEVITSLWVLTPLVGVDPGAGALAAASSAGGLLGGVGGGGGFWWGFGGAVGRGPGQVGGFLGMSGGAGAVGLYFRVSW